MAATLVARVSGRERRPETIRVWDPLVRLLHWSIVLAFATAWLSEAGERVHEISGYVVLALVAVRLVWGVIGTRHARFADFVRGPRRVLAYLRDVMHGRAHRYLGHNPAGGLMILALLGLLLTTAGSGWLMTTDAWWGSEWLEDLHEAAANATLLLVPLHILGVVVSSLAHRENLVLAMLTGRKRR